MTADLRREIERIVDDRIERAWGTRDDLGEIKAVMRETVEIQQRTNATVDRLAEEQQRTSATVDRLAEAQQRTEAAMQGLAEQQQRTEGALQGLAEQQQRTNATVDRLAEEQQRTEAAMQGLAGEQQRTSATVDRLAEEQQRTSATVDRLAEAQQRTEAAMQGLARAVTDVRQEMGGLSRTMGYSLENEAYRGLPGLLRDGHNIEILERFVRQEVGGEEINFLARARRAGTEVLVVGESKLRLGDRPYQPKRAQELFEQLDRKARAAQEEYPGLEVVRLLVTHFATSRLLQEAEARGVLVVQSHEW